MTGRKFAQGTEVAVEKSRHEIESLLERYGCPDYGFRLRPDGAILQFVAHDRRVRFSLMLPLVSDERFQLRPIGGSNRKRKATPAEAEKLRDAECRRLWRCLALSIKAKLEAVQSGIAIFEDEFLANVVDPVTGRTVAEVVRPQLAKSYLALPNPEPLVGLPEPPKSEG